MTGSLPTVPCAVFMALVSKGTERPKLNPRLGVHFSPHLCSQRGDSPCASISALQDEEETSASPGSEMEHVRVSFKSYLWSVAGLGHTLPQQRHTCSLLRRIPFLEAPFAHVACLLLRRGRATALFSPALSFPVANCCIFLGCELLWNRES